MIPKRGKGKSNTDYGRPAIYRDYIKSVKDMQEYYQVSQPLHSKVLNNINKSLSKAIMEESLEFILPARLGVLRIKKYKPTLLTKDGELNKRHLNVDWKKTKQMWSDDPEARELKKVCYYENNHSEGYNYRWYYSNYRSLCKNKSAYCFKPTRTNKRTLAKLVKDPDFKGDYYE